MVITTRGGSLQYEFFYFPDGQPHFKLKARDEFEHATIEIAITNPSDYLKLLLVKDALTALGYMVSLDLRYLMGGRMDRRINAFQPATLEVITRGINQAGFHRLRVLDPHSDVTLKLLNAEACYPVQAVRNVLAHYNPEDTVIIIPDAGAIPRVERLLDYYHREYQTVNCYKHRDSETGKLDGFIVGVPELVKDKGCLILDDICDGGGTFVGLAEKLREAGAKFVDLFVTHGVFSKETPLKGITNIYTTDSYRSVCALPGVHWQVVNMYDHTRVFA